MFLFLALIAVCESACRWNERSADGFRKAFRPIQIHLSTCVLLMFLTGLGLRWVIQCAETSVAEACLAAYQGLVYIVAAAITLESFFLKSAPGKYRNGVSPK